MEEFMKTLVFDSHLLPDGHLSCPKEFVRKKNVQFKVLVVFEETERQASDRDLEQAAIQDTGDEFLSQNELDYYLSLDEEV
jgi:hypothetical protein